MKADPFKLPDKVKGDGGDSGKSRALTRGGRSQVSETGEKTQNEEARASVDREYAECGVSTESSSRALTIGETGHLGIRLLRVAVLAVCYFLLEIVVKAVTVFQFILVAWKKRPHSGMQRLGEMIARYMEAMWLYCTFASDDAPWPFRSWPRGEAEPQS